MSGISFTGALSSSETDQALCCRIVESEVDFAKLESVWKELAPLVAWPSLLQSWEWARAWWAHFGRDERGRLRGLYIVVVEDRASGDAMGIVPLHYSRRQSALAVSLKPRRLEAFGKRGRDEVLGDEPELLLRRGIEGEILRQAVEHLYSPECRAAWDFLWLKTACLPGKLLLDGPPEQIASRGVGRYWERVSYPGRMSLRLGQDTEWGRYRRSLSKSMRDNTAYYPHRLRKHGRHASVEYVTEPDAIDAALSVLIDLHTRRAHHARGVPHDNHLPGAAQQGMLRELMRTLAANSEAFVAIYRIDGAPAAAQAFLRRGEAIVFYYAGYDPDLAQYSPLTLLTIEVLQRAMAEGCTEIDFLPGKAAWKERWGATAEYDVEEIFCISGTGRSRLFASGRRALMPILQKLRR